ncbi:hemin uptake protein HemP [Gammaproteobacteria bacterium PRO2]|jgi:hemin uptake protein HemP|nr:hemin uptake protein HemP [Gammaproteobacteria bacterium]MCE7901679.1 hemin uptake protein HemP [Gammaproteobacteria bacterium PRO9]MCL4777177.1 hemin uptake protein HemP [Gammaproteobacteria bacterium]MCQ3935117.1 hemin uptake protein HemP [Gammaproteobacteria bacterium]MDL1880588.1 hemin uptake protein HemP [Gammaproteobacteria bacterium PRO2]
MRRATPDYEDQARGAASGAAPATPTGVTVICSEQLFGPLRSVWIRHGRELYRLQVTRHGKLILTK